MGTLAYARPDDNIAPDATVTAVPGGSPGSEDPEYPAQNLVNLDVANPAKLTTAYGGWHFAFSAPVTLVTVALLNHNFDAGLPVLLQGDAAASTGDDGGWATPDFEQAFTVPADEEDGFSVNPWIDLSASPQTYRYWRIYVDGSPANSENLALGEAPMVIALRSLPDDFQVAIGLEESEEMPDIIHESGFGGRSAYSVGAKWKIWDGGMAITVPDDHWALARQARGRTRPWLFIPDRALNAAYLVTFDWTGPRHVLRWVVSTTYGESGNGMLVSVPAFRLRECSRGVPL